MPRNYVDNAMNRSLGRVGMPVGSAVHSRSSGSGSAGSFSSYNSPASSSRTYVDNPMNRSLGRVGLPLGSAVHSKSTSSPSSSSDRSLSSAASSSGTYVDNPMNRSLGRVGLPKGSAVHSKSTSSPSASSNRSSSSAASASGTYVDNPMNRSLGRVGLPKGSASSNSASERVYVDNWLNRKLERVGLPHGTAVHGKTQPISRFDGKVYKDNDFNRKHNRVGLPLGSKPIKKGDDVGLPKKKGPVHKNKKLSDFLQLVSNEEYPVNEQPCAEDSGFLEASLMSHYDNQDPEEFSDDYNHVVEALNRTRQEDLWMELKGKSLGSSTEPISPSCELTMMRGKSIKLEDLNLLDKIGHGGFGEVWLAEYDGLALAVKILTQSNLSKKRLALFETEIFNHSQLDHPNIVKFYGPCLERPKLAIVMEYMDASLWDSIQIHQVSFLPAQKLHILQDITSGLNYLHSIPLVHGDLKAQNVLLANVPGWPYYLSEQPTIAKLSDFGLSQLKSDSETTQTRTQKKLPEGATLRFSAPELLRGEMLGTSDMLKTDIYSMGLLIIELAVEETPFEDLTIPQLIKHVGTLGMKPAVPSGFTLHKSLEDMLHQCWSFKPTERPNAGQLKKMASRVQAILEDEE